MPLSPPTLHPPLRLDDAMLASLSTKLANDALARRDTFAFEAVEVAGVVRIPLTTVSQARGFDATIMVGLAGPNPIDIPLLVDSGNATLILPRWEDVAGRPGYVVLGEAVEPWGCPAKIVRGPVLLEAAGGAFTLDNCVFYACKANNASGVRTANFGAGCLAPWTAGGWNTPVAGTVLKSPLAYATGFPFATFTYAADTAIFAADNALRIATNSWLTLTRTEPAGFTLFDIRRDLEWMSVVARGLSIGGVATAWPDPTSVPVPLAVIDTGGTCAFLSDPGRLICGTAWPHPVANPPWTQGSVACESVADAITIEIGDATRTYRYTIDPAAMAPSVRGLTLVMCQDNVFMRDEPGMNIGGISALMNDILIDYAAARVGFRAR